MPRPSWPAGSSRREEDVTASGARRAWTRARNASCALLETLHKHTVTYEALPGAFPRTASVFEECNVTVHGCTLAERHPCDCMSIVRAAKHSFVSVRVCSR